MSMPLESQYAISDFELLEVLGRGASAKCQKAIYKPTNQAMALKIITMDDANKRKQFVNMLDAFFHDGTVYIALEYMDGGSIDNIQK